MKKLVIASCAVISLGLTGCTQTSESRGALRGGGIGAAAGALAALVIPGFPVFAGLAMGAVGGAGIGAATAKHKTVHHSESERYPVDQSAPPAEAAPADAVPAEAPPGG